MIRYRIFARVELFEALPLTTSRHLASRAVIGGPEKRHSARCPDAAAAVLQDRGIALNNKYGLG
jgi:hypothetical protein